MPKFQFKKLVRDKILEHQLSSGAKVEHRLLDESEHKQELVKKIIEEAGEIANATGEELAEEIADVQQAIDDLIQKVGLTREEVLAAQIKKNEKNGSFSQGIYIEHGEVLETDPWLEHYRKNPDKYPEIKD